MKEKKILYWHELMTCFNPNPNGTFNTSDLCILDNITIKSLIEKGYSLGDISKAAFNFFKSDASHERYKTIKRFIDNFQSMELTKKI